MARRPTMQDQVNLYKIRGLSALKASIDIQKLQQEWIEKEATHNEAEQALKAIILEVPLVKSLPRNGGLQEMTMFAILKELMAPIAKAYRARSLEAERKQIAAFQESASGRKITARLSSHDYEQPGRFVSSDGQIFTVISCDYISEPADMNQRQSGYVLCCADPTEEEMQTGAYKSAKHTLEVRLSFQETLGRAGRSLAERNQL